MEKLSKEYKIVNKNNYFPIYKSEIQKSHHILISPNNLKILIIFFIILFFVILIIVFIYFFTSNSTNNTFENKNILSKQSVNSVFKEPFINNLKKIIKNDDNIIENELLSKHTTFKLGGPAKLFIIPKTSIQIIEIIKLCNNFKVHYFILGNGSNLLVSDEGYKGVIIQINEKYFSNLDVKKENENNFILTVGGGMFMKTLSIEACLLSLTGLEDIIDIPGTIGGGIIMNASFKGTGLRNSLLKVKVITPEAEMMELTKEECRLIRRGSMLKTKKYIIIEATFKLEKGDQIIIQKTMTNNTKIRYEKQPMYFGSAGCFFVWDHDKNGSQYKKYKESNLVGYRVGNAMIYTYNISFIVNLGNATSSQVIEIVTYIEKIMKEKYKIKIRREVILIGYFNNIEYY